LTGKQRRCCSKTCNKGENWEEKGGWNNTTRPSTLTAEIPRNKEKTKRTAKKQLHSSKRKRDLDFSVKFSEPGRAAPQRNLSVLVEVEGDGKRSRYIENSPSIKGGTVEVALREVKSRQTYQRKNKAKGLRVGLRPREGTIKVRPGPKRKGIRLIPL